MLKRVVLKNVQRFKTLDLEFSPLITTIVGDTDTGKSTVMRALMIVCLNRVSGDGYIRHGKKSLKVDLHLSDGKKIVREKGKGINSYFLDGKRFNRDLTGKSVPAEIDETLNIGPENFQRQLDLHFWFSDTPGQVSKSLNKIVNLEKIDSTLATIASDLRSAKADYELIEKRSREWKHNERALRWAVEFDRDLTHLEELETEAAETALAASNLRIFVQNAEMGSRTIKTAIRALQGAKKAVLAGKLANKARTEGKALRDLAVQIYETEKLVNAEVPDLGPLLEMRKSGDALSEKRATLEALINDLNFNGRELCRVDQDLQTASARLSKLARKCPKCGQLLPAKKSSPSSAPICTSHTDRPSSEVRRPIGTRPRPATSPNSMT